ncbi:MAG: hypothetical protein GC162_01710 [Planctomycetes bacterium]|nr:hypothetical protein [Planctomycetota bacterium]
MKPIFTLLLLTLAATAAHADEPAADPIDQMKIIGQIDGANIAFGLSFDVNHASRDKTYALITGDVVLAQISTNGRDRVTYDADQKTYRLAWPERGQYHVDATFAARPAVIEGGAWREATFTVPASRVRELKVIADRTDLEVRFDGALRQERTVEDGHLVVTAILGPGKPFTVRWKPQVQALDAALMLSSRANTIARITPAALRLDTIFTFDIAQGRLSELAFDVPAGVSVTQVRGGHIRDWKLTPTATGQRLDVTLNAAQTNRYDLQLIAEMVLPKFPAQVALPVIAVTGDARTSGHLAIGTDSAIALVVKQTSGLSQIDAGAFPRSGGDAKQARPLPTGNAFFYTFAGGNYQLALSLDEIVPAYDAAQRLTATVREDDLIIEAQVELDVRDAPLRSVNLDVPKGYSVTNVGGPGVDDYRAQTGADGATVVAVHFREPIVGRTLIDLRLELGHGPLDKTQTLAGLRVEGAKNERGYVVIAAEEGVQLERPQVKELREVHTGSVPMRVAAAQFAYRFRESNWSLTLDAKKKASGMRVESFHLIALGEGLAYGSVVVNYFISGAPVDELKFTVPAGLENVEFVGRDVRRWDHDGELYTVKLSRKVIGDYNLGVVFRQRYADGGAVLIGGVEVLGAETQTGFIALTSHLNLQLETPKDDAAGLLEIAREEVPANYRLLLSAPVLKTYKYVRTPHRVALSVKAYERGELLPVVIEVTQMATDIAVDDQGRAESVTRVRYKIKNTSSQFLTLSMPAGANVWSTHMVEMENGQEKRIRVTASFDAGKGQLLIPLKRPRNPNDPMTVELEYGQSHDPVGWGGRLNLEAPRSLVRSTYAQWSVSTPDDWSIHAAGGNMLAEERAMGLGDLSLVLGHVGEAWGEAIERVTDGLTWLFLLAGACGLVLLVRVINRPLAGAAMLTAAALLVLIVGLMAGLTTDMTSTMSTADDLRSLSFTQPVNLSDKDPLTIEARVVPAWRQHATFIGAVAAPIAAIGLLVLGAVWRKARALCWSLGVTGLIYAAAQFDVITINQMRIPVAMMLGHVLTWGVAAVLVVYVIWRTGMIRIMQLSTRPVGEAGMTAMALAALMLLSGGRASAANLATDSTMKRVIVELNAEPDSMKIDYHVWIDAKEPATFRLLDDGAILMSDAKISERARVYAEDGSYWLRVERAGAYEVRMTFLSPLGAAADDGSRAFAMPMPASLTNQVQLTIPRNGLVVESPGAMRFVQHETAQQTIAVMMAGPGEGVRFAWRPRLRQTSMEKSVVFAEVTSLLRFDTAIATGHHQVQLQIAQGELSGVQMKLPDNMTVSAVEGERVGAWRFDPATHMLEARLTQPVSGEYTLSVTTQITGGAMPWSATVRNPQVIGATEQRGSVGVVGSGAVYVQIGKHPQAMNAEDFTRAAAKLMQCDNTIKPADLRYAYRTVRDADEIEVTAFEIKPELRSAMNGSFSVGDERLVLNGELAIEVAKAGVFSVELRMPAAYDIDALTAPQISHWDESVEDGVRIVQVHFVAKTLGVVTAKLALSRPVTDLPAKLDVPRVEVAGSMKHSGQVVVQAVRGVRLSIAQRNGISELNPADLGIREAGVLAFRLLKPDWEVGLATEVVEPRITVDYLHAAAVSEGLVRHTHYLRYRLAHAGAKVFEVRVPAGALGLLITGPEIANMKPDKDDPTLWRIELARKWFDRPYPLTLRYETQFKLETGQVTLEPVEAIGGDLYHGDIVVRTSDKVELKALTVGPTLTSAEPRNIDRQFGAGDLSDAALTYSTNAPTYALTLSVQRHDAAKLLEADVEHTSITTVVNERGQSINHVELQMRVGAKRHLATRLPEGASIWSLMVNNRSTLPSLTHDAKGEPVTLIPLGHAGVGELPVTVELIYIVPAPGDWRTAMQHYEGPRFDLPLKDVTWRFFVPEDMNYESFEGTLSVNDQVLRAMPVSGYGVDAYEQQQQQMVEQDNRLALELQSRGQQWAQQGEQYKAKQALESAYNYSFNDAALNEDARVQLHQLSRQQAMVGLKGRRAYLRPRDGSAEAANAPAAVQDLGDQFSAEQADRELGALDRFDSENLERITDRIIDIQEAAAGEVAPLSIHMPTRGRLLEFDRPLQVKADSPMTVSFAATPMTPPRTRFGYYAAVGLFAGLCLLMLAAPRVTGRARAAGEVSEANEAE